MARSRLEENGKESACVVMSMTAVSSVFGSAVSLQEVLKRVVATSKVAARGKMMSSG